MSHIHIETIKLANGKSYELHNNRLDYVGCARCALSPNECCGSLKRMCVRGNKKYLVEIVENDREKH